MSHWKIGPLLAAMQRSAAANRTGSAATNYIWSMGYALKSDVNPFNGKLPADYSTTDHSWFMDPRRYVKKLQEGDIVWIASRFLSAFITHCLPGIKTRITLIVSDGDDSFPSSIRDKESIKRLIEDPRLLSVFAQNADGTFSSPKIHPLPIGLDFHTINRRGGFWGESQQTAQEQERILEDLLAGLPPFELRKPKAYVDFHLSDRMTCDGTRRSEIFHSIYNPICIDIAERQLARRELWGKKGQYAFSISPHGNGLDCHRTWEDLVLGCIVIVKTSPLDSLYEGLPVVIVNKWNEVTPAALEYWMAEFIQGKQKSINRQRLTLNYWMDKIRDETRRALVAVKV